MARPELFETHQTKVREELAHCIRMAREGRAQAAANARAVAAAVRNNMPPFLGGPGAPLGVPGGLGINGPGGLGLGPNGGIPPGLPFGPNLGLPPNGIV